MKVVSLGKDLNRRPTGRTYTKGRERVELARKS